MQNLSRGAAQAGVAIDIARQLETALAGIGATGKGLHEKTGSVEGKLPAALVTKLRFIASVRNKVVHEDELLSDDDLSAFVEAGQQAAAALADAAAGKAGKRRAKRKPSRKPPPRQAPAAMEGMAGRAGRTIRLGGLAFLGGVAPVFLLMVLGNDGPGLWIGAFVIYFLLGWQVLRRSRRAGLCRCRS